MSYLLPKRPSQCERLNFVRSKLTNLFAMYSRLHSSYDVARRTVLLMREICSKTRWANAVYVFTQSGMLVVTAHRLQSISDKKSSSTVDVEINQRGGHTHPQ